MIVDIVHSHAGCDRVFQVELFHMDMQQVH